MYTKFLISTKKLFGSSQHGESIRIRKLYHLIQYM